MITENQLINQQILDNGMTDEEFFALEIVSWESSDARDDMLTGQSYYEGEHDILDRTRTAIGSSGDLEEIENMPNNTIVDNRFARMVDQKKNYILGKPITFRCDDDEYYENFKSILDSIFMRAIKVAGEEALIGGISWLYPYIDDNSKLKFKVFPSYEICPFWKDSAHTELDCAARLYTTDVYIDKTKTTVTMVEIYKDTGVTTYQLDDSDELVLVQEEQAYITVGTNAYNWNTVPLIAIKANSKEIPIINRVKYLQDALNMLISDFVNNMEENVRDCILVLKNYDGTDLGEFRKNLASYGAIKTRTEEGSSGGVDVLRIEVNGDNYQLITQMLIRAITQNARGFEARDEKLTTSEPNQLNIRSMYSDIDLDANEMETELQAAFVQIFEFISTYLLAFKNYDNTDKSVEVIFNRDILINETEAIENCVLSKDILSKETIIAQHPWVQNIKQEMDATDW